MQVTGREQAPSQDDRLVCSLNGFVGEEELHPFREMVLACALPLRVDSCSQRRYARNLARYPWLTTILVRLLARWALIGAKYDTKEQGDSVTSWKIQI